MKFLYPLFLFLFAALILNAQENGDNQTPTSQGSESTELDITITGLNPLTGETLPGSTPYPIDGVPGDGKKDKLDCAVKIEIPEKDYNSPEFTENEWEVGVEVSGGNKAKPDWKIFKEQPIKDINASFDSKFGVFIYCITMEFDRTANLDQLNEVFYEAFIKKNGKVVRTFYTEIKVGNPILTMNSRLTTNRMISEDVAAISEVSGITGLAFGPGYQSLKGRGPLKYEKFLLESKDNRCQIESSTADGSWMVEVIFPDGMFSNRAPFDTIHALFPPEEVVVLIEPTIKESAKLKCGTPFTVPYPKLIHFYSVFYSWHGGRIIKNLDDLKMKKSKWEYFSNEMDESRGGLVMKNWEPGEGNVIARLTYERKGSQKGDKKTIIEYGEITTLELKWPE